MPQARLHTAAVTASLHYTHGPAFAVAEVTALAFAESVEPVLQELAERTRQHGDRRLLINLLDVVGTFGHDEQKVIGLLAYRYLSHLDKVASLVPPEKITRVSEGAARAQGMELRVFTGFGDAVQWLSS
jgi:hypothetical protein